MIQEIGEGRFNPAYMRKNPQEDDILLHYEYNKVMLIKEGDRYRLPAFRDLKGEEDAVESVSYLFSIDSKGYYLADTFQMPEFGGFVMEGLQIFRSFEPMEDGFAGITGSQIYRWRESRRFCGCCGGKMAPGEKERSMVCQGSLPSLCSDRRLSGNRRDL